MPPPSSGSSLSSSRRSCRPLRHRGALADKPGEAHKHARTPTRNRACALGHLLPRLCIASRMSQLVHVRHGMFLHNRLARRIVFVRRAGDPADGRREASSGHSAKDRYPDSKSRACYGSYAARAVSITSLENATSRFADRSSPSRFPRSMAMSFSKPVLIASTSDALPFAVVSCFTYFSRPST
jgi:hypothetical protein